MTNYFICIYHYFRNHRLICWLSMVVLFVFFGYFATQIHLEEDINKLMPSSKNEDGTTKLAFADLKIKDKTFLLFEDTGGVGSSKLHETCDAFVDSLLAEDKDSVIGDIFYRLDEDLLPEAVDYLSNHLPAYIDTTAYARFDSLLTREHFVQQMLQNHEDLVSEVGEMFPELVEMDPMGMRNVLAEQMKPLLSAGSYQTIDNHFFVPDSTVCIAFITPRFSSTNTGQGSALFEQLNKLISQFAISHPNIRITYHGTPASGYYNSTQIKHDLTTTITGALVLVLLFLLFCFRRWDTIPLLLLPVVFGTLFGLSMMYWLKGEFSLLALGIGGVVLGVALSYVLHILTHHQYVGDGEKMLRDQVKPVLLGCITTIGSFAGLIFINTALLQDFGLFAAFAILGTTLFSLTYLPQMLSSKTNPSSFKWLDRINSYPFDQKKPLLAVVLLVVVIGVGAYFVGGIRFDADMHNLGYLDDMTEYSEQLLRKKTYTGDKTKYFASQGKTMEEAVEKFAILDHKLDSMQQLGLVKSYTRTNQIFVPMRVQQERIQAWKIFWSQDRLAKVRTLIAQTAPQADLNAEAFDTFFTMATNEYEPDSLYAAGLIPEGYQSTMMEQSYGGDYLCFTSVRCKNDSVRSNESDYIRICDAIASNPNLLVLDTYYYTTDTLLQMNDDFNVLQWLSMLFVFVVLLLSFHFNLKHTLLGFMPILLSWLIVLGAMVLFDVRFNLISIIISTFIFGIGVDYSIFVMNGLISDKDNKLQYHKTAILLSAVTLLTTVSSMLIATHPAIRSVGFSTLVGLLSAVILAYVLQPAVYRWLNQHKK
ncbi:MAG: MMPL family transporter [Prevotella sp.]|nr:MMPL family transporter [Prevotella sp.]